MSSSLLFICVYVLWTDLSLLGQSSCIITDYSLLVLLRLERVALNGHCLRDSATDVVVIVAVSTIGIVPWHGVSWLVACLR